MTADVALEPVKVALDQGGKYQHDKLNHIQASCPGPNHRRGDRNYSLSIDYDPTRRKVLMWCHVCGPIGDMDAVRDALGLSIADLRGVARQLISLTDSITAEVAALFSELRAEMWRHV